MPQGSTGLCVPDFEGMEDVATDQGLTQGVGSYSQPY